MTCMSLLNLLPDKAKVVQGSIKFNNIDLLNVSIEDIRKVRGSEIAMIMQNPIWAKLFWDWKSRIRERFGFWEESLLFKSKRIKGGTAKSASCFLRLL
ncbi:hypothetical protein [Peribacillus sp. NJ4]|uniref:hypothetical protein n=1 Tax=Peribacillus sp. NJ4 TaxID=3055862 RepID=UPI00338DD617